MNFSHVLELRKPAHRSRFIFSALIVMVLVSSLPFTAFAAPHTQDTPPATKQPIDPNAVNPNRCFAVSDGYIDDNGNQIQDGDAEDTLAFLNRITGNTDSITTFFPNTGTFNIEAIAFRNGASPLYAADAGRIGALDLNSGAFTFVGDVGTASDGYTFRDIDSLSWDVTTARLYGVERVVPGADRLVRLDPGNGSLVAGEFNGADYVEVQPQNGYPDVDDIAIDPVTGVMYAIQNRDGGPSQLSILDQTTGETLTVGSFTRADSGAIISDMEGLSFYNDGQLYGTTGKAFEDRNVLWQINEETAVATLIGEFTQRLVDVEASDCLTAPGFLAIEKQTNGVDADAIPGVVVAVDEPVQWDYIVRNTGGVTINDIVVVDDQEGNVCQIPSLAPGQSNAEVGVECTLSGTAIRGQYSNTATANGTGDDDINYSGTDTSNYFGVIPIAIGDYVWRDTNANGIQDPFEVGVVNATVKIFQPDGTLVAETTTNENGFYVFDALVPGDYFLEFELPAGFDGFTQPNQTDGEPESDARDSDADPDTGRTEIFTLAEEGISDFTWDAGVLGDGLPATLGNFVWEDRNNNGVQDEGEPGIADVTVELYQSSGELLDTMTTDENGMYLWDDLSAGDYSLRFVLPEGYESFAAPNQGDSDETDSDPDPDTGQTTIIALSAGEEDLTWDAGIYRQTGAISGSVVEDANRDNALDEGDTPLDGIRVILLDADENVVDSTTSDENGNYEFENLPPGDYIITLDEDTIPENLVPSFDRDDTADNRTAVPLTAGEAVDDANFGLASIGAALGDMVFLDLNEDGVMDDGEPGVANITVELLDEDGEVVEETTTDNLGKYEFTDLAPATYRVRFSLPDGNFFSPQDQGADDALDSDVDPTTGETGDIVLSDGADDRTNDAGIFSQAPAVDITKTILAGAETSAACPGSEDLVARIGDTVTFCFVIQNTGNTYLTDLQLVDELLDIDIDITEAGLDGAALAPSGNVSYAQTVTLTEAMLTADTDNDDDKITNVARVTGQVSDPEGNPTDDDPVEDDDSAVVDVDQTVTVDGFVFNDRDADGIRDEGEEGLEDILVSLLDDNDEVVGTTTTDNTGYFIFDDLPAGNYSVRVEGPTDSRFSPQDQGDDEDNDSDVDPEDGTSSQVTVDPENDTATIGAGVIFDNPELSIDKTVRAGEGDASNCPGTETLTAQVGDTVTYCFRISNTGNTYFTNVSFDDPLLDLDVDISSEVLEDVPLAPGASVTYALQTPLQQDWLTGDNDNNDNRITNSATLTGTPATNTGTTLGDPVTDTDTAVVDIPPTALGDFVWEDTDGDGVQDDNEPGVDDVNVMLLDEDGDMIAQTSTDSNGRYFFEDLVAGTYMLKFTAPNGFTFINPDQGDNDKDDSDVDPATGKINNITLRDGEIDDDQDAGLVRDANINGRVFDDANGNGIRDLNEDPIGNATVELLDEDGDIVATTTTDTTGRYAFSDIAPGEYFVRFRTLDGLEFTIRNAGNDDSKDSDADPSTGVTEQFSVNSGQGVDDVDAGFIRPSTIRGVAFDDRDADGIRDTGEPNLSDIVVRLVRPDGSIVESTTTDQNGNYEFTGLTPGNYFVRFETRDGYTFTLKDRGSDDTDSDVDPTNGQTDPVPVGSGETISNVDSGFYRPASFDGNVFRDADRDGIFRGADTVLGNYEVRLLDSNGSIIASTRTDGAGNYSFANLRPGNYQVEVARNLPDREAFSPANQGGDDTIDSDFDNRGRVGIELRSGDSISDVDAGITLEDTPAPTATPTQIPSQVAGVNLSAPTLNKRVISGGGVGSSVNAEQAGTEIVYEISFTNQNSASITDVIVQDRLAPETEYISATSSRGTVSYDAASHTLTANGGTVAANERFVVTVRAKIKDNIPTGTIIRNTATLSSSAGGATSNEVRTTVAALRIPETGHETFAFVQWWALLIVVTVGTGLSLFLHRKFNRRLN